MIEYLIFIFILSICALSSVVFGKYLPMALPYMHPLLDRKPFTCRPCLTFHLMWIITAIFAIILQSLDLFAMGVIVAFVIYLIVRIIDKQKIEE